MRIILAQTSIIWEDKESNIAKAEDLISSASETDYIFFPEMSFTGFSMNTNKTGESNCETVNKMVSIAKRNNVGIGFGWVRKTDSKCENTYSVIDPQGNLVSEYVKIHPFSYSGEDKFFYSGKRIDTYSLKGIPFSTFICYDLRFPEVFREVADKVHAVIIPACWPQKRSEHWKTLLKARAIENQIYIFAINCQGDIGGQYYSGNSSIINPNGEVINSIVDKQGTIEYDFIDDVDIFRNGFPVLRDKKVSFGD